MTRLILSPCQAVYFAYNTEKHDTVVKILGYVYPLRAWCNACVV
jgi:hypothetical protein